MVNERDELGPEPGARLHDVGARRRLLRLAVQLLRAACRSAGAAAAAGPGRQGDPARLRAELARRARSASTFYTGDSFPALFRGGAFVGEHGSWNRDELNGYKVVFIRFAGRPPGRQAA